MKRNWLGLGTGWGAAIAGLGLISLVGCGDDKKAQTDAMLPPITADGGSIDAIVSGPLQIVAAPAVLSVNEGSSGTVLVVLSKAPPAPLTLTVTSSVPGLAAVAPATLTFSAANFGVPQAIVVTGVEDADLASGTANITLSGAGVPDAVIAVTITDDDVQSLVVAPPSLTLTEGGVAGSASVHLAFAPATDVAVTVTSSDPDRLGIAPATLTFTAANFATPQTVALAGKADVDNVTNNASVVFKATGVADATVAVTIIDVDAQSLVIAPASLMIDEGDAAGGTFTVKLARQPDREIKVNLAALGAQGVTVTPAELTFTAANYNTVQSVKVVAAGDDNTADETVEVTASVAGLTPQKINVMVKDDDAQSIVLSAETVALSEGGTGSFTVKLAFNPGATVTVAVASAKASAASVSPTVLTFTSANFGVAQAVTVSGVQDDDVANESVVLTASSTGLTSKTITATVTDNDVQAIAVAPTSISVVETGSEALKVRLAFRPAASVTVAVASDKTAAATVSPATLTFTPENFATEQTVTVSGTDDSDLLESTAKVTLSSTGVANKDVNVTVVDNDVQNILVSPSSLALSENGSAKTFTANLAFAPQAGITVNVTSSNPKVTVSPTSFTLTDTAAQTITVTPSQDDDAVDEVAIITLSGGSLTSRTVSVDVDDDDVQAHLLSTLGFDVTEEGAAATFTVKLQAKPVSNTVVTITSAQPSSVVLSNGGAFAGTTTLTFTPDDYTTAQTVSAKGLADLNLVDEVVAVTASSAVAPSASLLVQNVENDKQGIVGAPQTQIVLEGTGAKLAISLKFQPKESVPVTVSSANSNIVSVNGGAMASLLFTTTNWDKPQLVDLATPDDPDQVDRGTTTLTVVSPLVEMTEYKTVTAEAKDDDRQAIVANPTGVPVTETQTAKFTVRLAFSPIGASETVTLTSANPAKVTVTPATIPFNAATYATPVEVTVTGVDDADLLAESVIVTLDSDVDGTANVPVTVSVTDNDAQAIVVSKTSIALSESPSGSDTFAVHLQFNPTQDLVVTLTSADPGAVTVSPATLTFTAGNYTVDQQVTVTNVSDPDVRNETVAVTLAAASVEQPVVVTTTVTDDDTQGIDAALSAVVLEGGTKVVPVKLGAEPTIPVTVSATSSIPGKFTVAPAAVTFTKDNWNIAQDVTLTGVQDDDLDDHTGSMVLSITSAQGVTPREGAANQVVAVTVGDDDSQTIVLQQIPAAPFELSVQEQGPSSKFSVKLGRKPRANQNDVVALTQSPTKILLGKTSLTFDSNNWSEYQEVTVWGLADADSTHEAVNVTLAISEASDPERQTGVTLVPPTAIQAVRVMDDEVAVIGGKLYSDLSGATEFTRRGNVNFGSTLFAFTGRNAQGAAVVARESRELAAFFQGPVVASGGVSPTGEVVEFDGSGFSVFSSDTTGIVFTRFSEDLGTILTPLATVAPGATDEFWPVRTDAGYSLAYRKSDAGNKGLYFRTVLLNGTVSAEQPITVPSPDPQQRVNMHYIPGSTYAGQSAPYLVVYSTNTTLRCLRLGPNGQKLAEKDFGSPAIVSSVQTGTSSEITLAYYDTLLGLVAKKLTAGTTAMTGACQEGSLAILRGPSTGIYLSAPTIAYNGVAWAVAFDLSVSGEERTGVALWNGAARSTQMLIGGDTTGTTDQGSRPSITWAGDRWVVRYKAETTTGVKVRTGAFGGNDALTVPDPT